MYVFLPFPSNQIPGRQAVLASDFALPQFRFLERLLLVHGRWNYKRIARFVQYFFYKNFYLGVTLFLYNAYAFFSGQVIYQVRTESLIERKNRYAFPSRSDHRS